MLKQADRQTIGQTIDETGTFEAPLHCSKLVTAASKMFERSLNEQRRSNWESHNS